MSSQRSPSKKYNKISNKIIENNFMEDSSSVFIDIKNVLTIDIETEEHLQTLNNILTQPDFLLKKVPNLFNMNDKEFSKTRDLLCVVLSYLQGRVITANGVSKTERTNCITSWRGKCQACGSAGNTSRDMRNRKSVKCKCKFSFHLNRQGLLYLKGEHTCPEQKKQYLNSNNKLISYRISDQFKKELLQSCLSLLSDNDEMSRKDIERHVNTELRRIGILSKDVTSGSFARLLYSHARALISSQADTEVICDDVKDSRKDGGSSREFFNQRKIERLHKNTSDMDKCNGMSSENTITAKQPQLKGPSGNSATSFPRKGRKSATRAHSSECTKEPRIPLKKRRVQEFSSY